MPAKTRDIDPESQPMNTFVLGTPSRSGTGTASIVPVRYIGAILVLAVAARGLILALNILWDIPPLWDPLPRTALAVAWSDFGRIPLGAAFERTYQISVEEALRFWPLNDRGIVYLFLLVHKLLGPVTYLKIQTINLAIDCLMILPTMSIARQIGGPKAAIAAGIVYALFLPQIQVAAAPDYNCWLAYSMIVMTWIVFRISDSSSGFGDGNFWWLVGGLAAASVIANEFRSISILFTVGAAGWLGFVSVLECRSLRLPRWRWQQIAALILVGGVTILVAAGLNKLVRGEFSPVRSTFGHSFWSGVGQFANPFGLRENDGDVLAFYERETGLKDTSNTIGVAYNAWLAKRAVKFIKAHPGLYASMVARRAVRIIFPNMAFSAVADLRSYTSQPEQSRLIERRQELVATNGWVSWKTISELTRIDPGYIVSLVLRVSLMLALPVGLLAALIWGPARTQTVMACLPLAYIVITLSGYYATPVVITATHASVLAASVAGWFFLVTRASRYLRKVR